jgi:hypothetical protein
VKSSCEHSNKPSSSIKCWAASQEGVSSTELVNFPLIYAEETNRAFKESFKEQVLAVRTNKSSSEYAQDISCRNQNYPLQKIQEKQRKGIHMLGENSYIQH